MLCAINFVVRMRGTDVCQHCGIYREQGREGERGRRSRERGEEREKGREIEKERERERSIIKNVSPYILAT